MNYTSGQHLTALQVSDKGKCSNLFTKSNNLFTKSKKFKQLNLYRTLLHGEQRNYKVDKHAA